MHFKALKRIEQLVDSGSFNEFESEISTGYITGTGTVEGRKVYISAIVSEEMPSNVFDGLQHHLNLLEAALKNPAPVVLILDIPGHQESTTHSPFPQDPAKLLVDRRGIGRWYALHSKLSGKVPQICVVCEKLGAAMTFPITLCDTAIMLEHAGMSIGRPDVVEKILGKKVDYKKLGGAEMHAAISGSIDKVVKTENEAFAFARNYLSFFPSYSGGPLPLTKPPFPSVTSPMISELIPDDPNMAFDMCAVITSLADTGEFLELRAKFAEEVITGLAKIKGKITGIIANNSQYRGGLFFPESCRKATRFISICDAFGIPLVFLSDSAGFMVGSTTEQAGIIREAGLMFNTIANTTVSRLSVAVRRDYTAGVYAMSGPGMDPETFIALPTAVISIYGKNVADKLAENCSDNTETQNLEQMLNAASNPHELYKQGLVDEIVPPEDLRLRISQFLKDKQSGKTASEKPVLLV